MNVIVLLIAAGGCVAGGFLVAFIWAVRSGQFDDTATPPLRVITEDVGRATPEEPIHASDRRPSR
jgi:cbb3-type cytochrome oxidase maturation protein